VREPPPEPGRFARLARRWAPWLVASAILAGLAARLPRAQLLHALAAGPAWTVALYSAGVVAAVLVADAWANLVAFRLTGVSSPWGGVLLARGATYILGLLNTAVGQGGMGLYLHRAGASALRSLGIVLFMLGTQAAALAVVAAAGLLAEGAAGGPGARAAAAPALAVLGALGAGLAVYLALLARRPAWLVRRELFAPALDAGARGLLLATAARLPHVLLMVVGCWGGLRLWGVAVPFGRGLVVLAVAVAAMALPVAPSGIGTLELALVALASPFAPGGSAAAGAAVARAAGGTHAIATAATAAQQADVLAFTLVYHLFGLIAQALLGLLCLALLARRRGTAADGAAAA
jgi:hypothetical protein